MATWSAGRAAPRTTADSPASWDLDADAAIAYALRNGPIVSERRDLEAVAEAEIGAAGQLTNPELRVGRTSLDSLAGSTDRVSVGLRIRPDMPWARSAKVAAARAGLGAERARTGIAQRDTAAQIRQLYASLAFGEATRDVIGKQLGVLTERHRVLAAQVARATATQLEAVLADEDLLDLEATRNTLEIELTRTRGELAELLGIPHGQVWRPVWDLAKLRVVETSFDRSALAARALAARPELAEAAHLAQAADALAYRERARRFPWFEYLQVERSVQSTVDWGVSLGVSIPLLSLNGGEIEAADARSHGATTARRRLATATLQQLDAAIALAETTGKRSRELTARVEPLNQAMTQLVAQSAGVADPVKLLLLEERHVRAERKVLEAAYEHRLALIALEALSGGSTWR